MDTTNLCKLKFVHKITHLHDHFALYGTNVGNLMKDVIDMGFEEDLDDYDSEDKAKLSENKNHMNDPVLKLYDQM